MENSVVQQIAETGGEQRLTEKTGGRGFPGVPWELRLTKMTGGRRFPDVPNDTGTDNERDTILSMNNEHLA